MPGLTPPWQAPQVQNQRAATPASDTDPEVVGRLKARFNVQVRLPQATQLPSEQGSEFRLADSAFTGDGSFWRDAVPSSAIPQSSPLNVNSHHIPQDRSHFSPNVGGAQLPQTERGASPVHHGVGMQLPLNANCLHIHQEGVNQRIQQLKYQSRSTESRESSPPPQGPSRNGGRGSSPQSRAPSRTGAHSARGAVGMRLPYTRTPSPFASKRVPPPLRSPSPSAWDGGFSSYAGTPTPQWSFKVDPWNRTATEGEGKRENSPSQLKITGPESLLTEAQAQKRQFVAVERSHQQEQNSSLEGILLDKMRVDKITKPNVKRGMRNLQTLRRRQIRAESAPRHGRTSATPGPGHKINKDIDSLLHSLIPSGQPPNSPAPLAETQGEKPGEDDDNEAADDDEDDDSDDEDEDDDDDDQDVAKKFKPGMPVEIISDSHKGAVTSATVVRVTSNKSIDIRYNSTNEEECNVALERFVGMTPPDPPETELPAPPRSMERRRGNVAIAAARLACGDGIRIQEPGGDPGPYGVVVRVDPNNTGCDIEVIVNQEYAVNGIAGGTKYMFDVPLVNVKKLDGVEATPRVVRFLGDNEKDLRAWLRKSAGYSEAQTASHCWSQLKNDTWRELYFETRPFGLPPRLLAKSRLLQCCVCHKDNSKEDRNSVVLELMGDKKPEPKVLLETEVFMSDGQVFRQSKWPTMIMPSHINDDGGLAFQPHDLEAAAAKCVLNAEFLKVPNDSAGPLADPKRLSMRSSSNIQEKRTSIRDDLGLEASQSFPQVAAQSRAPSRNSIDKKHPSRASSLTEQAAAARVKLKGKARYTLHEEEAPDFLAPDGSGAQLCKGLAIRYQVVTVDVVIDGLPVSDFFLPCGWNSQLNSEGSRRFAWTTRSEAEKQLQRLRLSQSGKTCVLNALSEDEFQNLRTEDPIGKSTAVVTGRTSTIEEGDEEMWEALEIEPCSPTTHAKGWLALSHLVEKYGGTGSALRLKLLVEASNIVGPLTYVRKLHRGADLVSSPWRLFVLIEESWEALQKGFVAWEQASYRIRNWSYAIAIQGKKPQGKEVQMGVALLELQSVSSFGIDSITCPVLTLEELYEKAICGDPETQPAGLRTFESAVETALKHTRTSWGGVFVNSPLLSCLDSVEAFLKPPIPESHGLFKEIRACRTAVNRLKASLLGRLAYVKAKVRSCWTHGNLLPSLVMHHTSGAVWALGPGEAHNGHPMEDFASLEASLLFECTELSDDECYYAKELSTYLAKLTACEDTKEFKDFPLPGNLPSRWMRVHSAIFALRQLAISVSLHDNMPGNLMLAAALLSQFVKISLPAVIAPDQKDLKNMSVPCQKWLLHATAVLAENLHEAVEKATGNQTFHRRGNSRQGSKAITCDNLALDPQVQDAVQRSHCEHLIETLSVAVDPVSRRWISTSDLVVEVEPWDPAKFGLSTEKQSGNFLQGPGGEQAAHPTSDLDKYSDLLGLADRWTGDSLAKTVEQGAVVKALSTLTKSGDKNAVKETSTSPGKTGSSSHVVSKDSQADSMQSLDESHHSGEGLSSVNESKEVAETHVSVALPDSVPELHYNRPLIIVGRAGVGKTLWLRQLAIRAAQVAASSHLEPLPIWIDAAAWHKFAVRSARPSLRQYLDFLWSEWPDRLQLLLAALESGRGAALLLDNVGPAALAWQPCRDLLRERSKLLLPLCVTTRSPALILKVLEGLIPPLMLQPTSLGPRAQATLVSVMHSEAGPAEAVCKSLDENLVLQSEAMAPISASLVAFLLLQEMSSDNEVFSMSDPMSPMNDPMSPMSAISPRLSVAEIVFAQTEENTVSKLIPNLGLLFRTALPKILRCAAFSPVPITAPAVADSCYGSSTRPSAPCGAYMGLESPSVAAVLRRLAHNVFEKRRRFFSLMDLTQAVKDLSEQRADEEDAWEDNLNLWEGASVLSAAMTDPQGILTALVTPAAAWVEKSLPSDSTLRFSCELIHELLVAEDIEGNVVWAMNHGGPGAAMKFLETLMSPVETCQESTGIEVPWRLHDPWWHRVWVFVAAMIPASVIQPLVSWLLDVDRPDGANVAVVHEMLQCMRQQYSVVSNAPLLAEHQLVLAQRISLCRPTELLTEAILHPSGVLRAMALAEIEAFEMDKTPFAEALLERVASYGQDERTQMAWHYVAAALETLGRLGCRRRDVIDKLASYWLRDPEAVESPVLRNAALEALRELGVTDYKSLRKAVKDEFSGEFSRKQALFTMEFLGTFDDDTMQLLCDDIELGRKDNTVFVVLMQGLCNFLSSNKLAGSDTRSIPTWVRLYPDVIEALCKQPFTVLNEQIRAWVEDVSINMPDRDLRSLFVGLRIVLQESDDGDHENSQDSAKEGERRGSGLGIASDVVAQIQMQTSGQRRPSKNRRKALTPLEQRHAKRLWYVGKLESMEEQVDYLLDFAENDPGRDTGSEPIAAVSQWCAVYVGELEKKPKLVERLINAFTSIAKKLSQRLAQEALSESLTNLCESLVEALFSLSTFQKALAKRSRSLEPFLVSCCLGQPAALPIGLRSARQKAQNLLATLAMYEANILRHILDMIERPGEPHWKSSRSRSNSKIFQSQSNSDPSSSKGRAPSKNGVAADLLEDSSCSTEEGRKPQPVRRTKAEAFALQKELWEALQSTTMVFSGGASEMCRIHEAPKDVRPWLFTPYIRGIRGLKIRDPYMELQVPVFQGTDLEFSSEEVYLTKESKLGRRDHLMEHSSHLSASARLLHLAERRDVEAARTLFKECPLVDVDTHGYICDGGCALAIAAQNNDFKFCKLLVDMKADVSSPSPYGIMPLHIAAQYGHVEIVELLLNNKANVNDVPRGAESPLMLAAERGLAKVAHVLLIAKADVMDRSMSGATPLSQACLEGFPEVIRVLIDAGAELDNLPCPEHSPLLNAARRQHNAAALLLLEKKAQVNNVKDPVNDNFTALHFAAKNANLELVRAILDAGAECDLTCWGPMDSPWTPLHLAVQSGSDLVVQRLLACDEGRNLLNVRSANGLHPVNVAIDKGLYHIEAGLRKHGGRKSLNTDLTIAAAAGEIDALKEAVEEGESHLLNERSNNGETPLTAALSKKHWDVGRWVMQQIGGEEVCKTTNHKGQTPLHILCSFRGTAALVTEAITDYGCNVNAISKNGETPLDFAMRRGDMQVINYVAQKGGRKNFQSSIAEGDAFSVRLWLEDGEAGDVDPKIMHSVLQIDSSSYDVIPSMLQVLHEYGADANALNDQDETPLDVLRRMKGMYQTKGGYAAMQVEEHITAAETRVLKLGGLRNPKSVVVRDQLRAAIDNRDNPLVEKMVEEGASANELLREAPHHGQTFDFLTMPLSWAILTANLPAAKTLLACGALINGTDASGATALHHAADNGDFQACQWLCESNADLTAEDMEGQTPLDWATRSEQQHITNFLTVLLDKIGASSEPTQKEAKKPSKESSGRVSSKDSVQRGSKIGMKVNTIAEEAAVGSVESGSEEESGSEDDPMSP